jgi:magnesium transporter
MNASDELSARFAESHPEDAARVLERAAPAETATFLAVLPTPSATSVVRHMNVSLAAAALSALEVSRAAGIIEELPLSHAASVLRQLGLAKAELLLESVAEKVAKPLTGVLRFRAGTAGAIADPQVLTLPSDINVGDAQKHLRRLAGDVAYNVYVTDRDHRLVGVVTVRELLLARPKQTLESIMKRQPTRLVADADLAVVAANPGWLQFDMLPVVDKTGLFTGVIRHRTLRQLGQTRAEGPGPVDVINVAMSIADMYWTSLSILAAGLATTRTVQQEAGPHGGRR